ncbi:hypothetical protein [Streptomyces millisiae]|uniref:Mutator family transposase n=1 Tax=Streptomyces millisiae TaxID=3075542 RepID=A0ABU2LXB3_9ACTN|nr:hypothetical protein [Streptomyces sp. DSM 44918]MDT0322237.1 hypothetical protein [Streptomyces sp. DSM 44918]
MAEIPEEEQQESPLTAVEAALGRMVYQAATFEMVMRVLATLLARDEGERDCVAEDTIHRLMIRAKKMAANHPDVNEEMQATLTAITTGVQPYIESRNTYIHDAWAELDGELSVMHKRKKNRFRTRRLAVPELASLTERFSEYTNQTVEWTVGYLKKRHLDWRL